MKRLPDKRLTPYRQRLVEDNVSLVRWHVGKRMKGFRPDVVNDAVAQCMLGLIRAAQLYDRHRKAVSTGKPVKFGTYAMHWIKCYFQRWTDKRVKELALGIVQMSSIGQSRGDAPTWEPASRSRDEAEEVAEVEDVERMLKSLPVRYGQLLRMRFVEGLTLEETGERMGITRERVRQLEKTAKGMLQRRRDAS